MIFLNLIYMFCYAYFSIYLTGTYSKIFTDKRFSWFLQIISRNYNPTAFKIYYAYRHSFCENIIRPSSYNTSNGSAFFFWYSSKLIANWHSYLNFIGIFFIIPFSTIIFFRDSKRYFLIIIENHIIYEVQKTNRL